MIGWGIIHYGRKLNRIRSNAESEVERVKDELEARVDDYFQEMYNEKCDQAHLQDMPMDFRSQNFVQYELGETLFARMSRVEQEAVLFNVLYKTYRERDDLALIREQRDAERHLHKVRAERLERARETIRNRLEVHRRMRDNVREISVVDPKTEYQINYSVDLREDEDRAIDRVVDAFPEKLFSEVTDDQQFLGEIKQ